MIFDIDKKEPGRTALTGEDGQAVSYGDISAFAAEFGTYLKGRGVVFCLCENVPESVLGYIAVMEAGSVPLLLGADIEPGLFLNLFNVYRPAYIWMPDRTGDEKKSGSFKTVMSKGGYVLFETGCECYEINSELALLLSTSGSTGSPKLVRLSRKNLTSNAASISEYLQIDEKERAVTTLPMQYTYGLSVINSHLLSGGCVLMTRSSIVRQEFWEFFKEYEGTSLAGVPYTYSILKKLHFFDMELDSLRTMTQAGGKLPVSLQEEYARHCAANGIRFYVMYGQTEATARMSYLPPERCLEKAGSIGIAIPGGRFFLQGDGGEEISEPMKAGELIYEGDNVSLGYALTADDLKKGDERGGVLETGDIALRDAEGYYYIEGRKKRFLKVFGVRIGLDECEQILRKRYPDSDFACAGEDDLIRIYTSDREAALSSPEYLAEALNINFRAAEAVYIDEIPRNDSGKIKYSELENIN